MKKIFRVLLLAILVSVLFVSCHECAVCGKSKLITSKKTILGKDIYVCKDCKDAPADAWNEVKDGVKQVEQEVKNLFK